MAFLRFARLFIFYLFSAASWYGKVNLNQQQNIFFEDYCLDLDTNSFSPVILNNLTDLKRDLKHVSILHLGENSTLASSNTRFNIRKSLALSIDICMDSNSWIFSLLFLRETLNCYIQTQSCCL